MKRCPECYIKYENTFDVCPTCGETLENINTSAPQYNNAEWNQGYANAYSHGATDKARNEAISPAYTFEQQSGRNVIINGAVAESSTQQYYQSKFTKFVHAVFSGEPFQLSHTSFETIIRIEEHTIRGYPERGEDVILYGNLQNAIVTGDDVTVTARRKGNRLIAKQIYNHSVNRNVRIQAYIPATVIRVLAAIMAIVIYSLLKSIFTADYSLIGSAILTFIMSSFMPILIVVGLIYFGRKLLKSR